MASPQWSSALSVVWNRDRWTAAAVLTAAALVLLALSGGGSVAASAQEAGAPTLQVFNGEDADIDDVPSVVAVFPPGGQCTGTVIGAEWVLTASHCFDDFDGDAEDVFVTVGVDQAEEQFETENLVQAEDYHLHPDYDDVTFEADVALIKLSEPVEAPAATLATADAQPPLGDDALIVGWGLLDEGTNEEPDVLQRGEMQFTDCATPLTEFGIPQDIHDRYVCLTSDTTEACVGDSGGPAFEQAEDGQLTQFGVLAFGSDRCQDAPHVSIYASVPFYLDWIVDTSELALGEREERDEDAATTPRFSDVVGTTFEAEIAALAAAEITSGRPDGTFGPGEPVRRGQMAAFLSRALELPEGGDSGLTDIGGRFEADINAIAAAGITEGRGDGTFGPGEPVRRGQMAAFLVRALELDTD